MIKMVKYRKGAEALKYKLIIDKSVEEEIVVTVHAPSSLTQAIEDLVSQYSGVDSILGYRDEELRKLSFSEIECVTVMDRKVVAIDGEGKAPRSGGGVTGLLYSHQQIGDC